MNKTKTLSKNIILFSISSLGTKLLSFFLVPFYTNFLSTSEYGTIDLVVNTASLLLPIFTLTVYDGVMRFTLLEKNNDEYFKIGIKVEAIGTIILGLIISIIALFFPAFIKPGYIFWIWIIFTLNAVYSLINNYVRAVDLVPVMVQGSIINSIILLSFNILFIAVLRLGVNGYFIAMSLGLGISIVYMLWRCIKAKCLDLTSFNTSTITTKTLLTYTIPLIFTAVAWWVNSCLDRYFVTWMCGVDENGIYSVAYKIPNLLVAFQTIFTQAWSISAITEFDSKDSDGFMGHTYEAFSALMLLACMGIMLINIPLSAILYAKDFFKAWQYVPILLCATLFGALAGYYGGIFAAVKNSKICAISTLASALINAILNYVMIPKYQVLGAALATLIAYFASWLIRAIASRHYIKLKINPVRTMLSYILLAIQMICALTENHYYIIQIVCILLIIAMYKKYFTEGAKKIKSKLFKGIRE